MQKLVWKNSIGDEIDLTSGSYGITEWEGFANTSLNIQSQQVPFQDGGVFLDALMEQRELSVTLAMNDGGNLETRYRLRRELIHALNPKLGEGYLIYTNDFISKRIKCVAQIPLFETHNSNDSGTPKASLTWVACEPYWEDLEQKSVSILSGGIFKVRNEGDVAISPTDIYVWGEGSNVSIKNLTNNTQLKISGAVKDINATLGMGQKDARLTKQYISFLEGGKTVETDYAQYTIASNCILKTSDFKTVENVKQFSSVSDITSDGKNVYVCDSTFIGMIKENGDYVERTDINASRIFYSKNKQKIYYSSPSGIYSLDSFDATPVLVITTEYQVYYFSDVGNDVLCCGAMGLLVNLTQNTVIPTNAGNKALNCVAPYKNGYAVVGASGFAQYNENGTWKDIPLNASAMLNEFCHNPYTDSYYFGGYGGFLAEIKSDNTKVVINTHTEGIVSYVFFSRIFETVQLDIDGGIAQIKNETELEIISQNDTNLTCCKYVDFLGKYVAGSQDAIFTSSDFKVWEQVFSESGIGIFTHIESDNTHVLLGISDSDNLYESSDGINFTKKQSIVGKLWVTYNTEAEKFFFIGDFGNNEYWICSVDNLLSNNVTKIHQIDTTNLDASKTNSASVGDTTVFIIAQKNDADDILYYTTDAGATWNEKTSSCTYLKDLFSNSCIGTRIVNQKLLLTIIKVPSVFFVMWDSQQEDFIVPTFVTDENYFGFNANYVLDTPYICGYIENGEDSAKRCIVHLSVEGTTVTITKVLEAVSTDVSLYMIAFTVGNQLVYSYLGSNGSTYAYYNGAAHESQIILKLKGYIAILIPVGDNQDYWSICDDNFNEITRISYDYLGNFFLNIPNNNSIVSNGENFAVLTDAWQLAKVPSRVSDTVCLFNFNGNIYIADSHFIYTENYRKMWGDDSITVYDCKVSADNKLYICTSNSYVRIIDDNFNTVQSIDVYPTFDKIYPLANGDIIGFAKSGDTKSIYKYDHNTEQTKKIYELTDQVTTFYDLGYFEKLNEVLLITNRGFLGIIDDYVTELLNPQYLTYAFVKNQQPRFVGVWGFKGTVDFTEGSSIINQVQEMTLKLEVGDNNLVFGYEGSSSMMLSIIYSPKYIGV